MKCLLQSPLDSGSTHLIGSATLKERTGPSLFRR